MASKPSSDNTDDMKIFSSLESFEKALTEDSTGLITIRPKVIFQLVEKTFRDVPIYSLPLPSSKIGSVTTLESSIICALLALKAPKIIFEFGTFLGFTTSTILRNMNKNSKLYSLDLPKDINGQKSDPENIDWEKIKSDDAYNDNFLTNLVNETGEIYLRGIEGQERLNLLKQDSLEFDPSTLDIMGKTDFIFLDGGHTDEIVRSDTKNSFEMLSPNGILLWHDFNSNTHQKVTDVVRECASERLVISIQHTMLAFTSKNTDKLFSTSI
jgi:hypothetical protein